MCSEIKPFAIIYNLFDVWFVEFSDDTPKKTVEFDKFLPRQIVLIKCE